MMLEMCLFLSLFSYPRSVGPGQRPRGPGCFLGTAILWLFSVQAHLQLVKSVRASVERTEDLYKEQVCFPDCIPENLPCAARQLEELLTWLRRGDT